MNLEKQEDIKLKLQPSHSRIQSVFNLSPGQS